MTTVHFLKMHPEAFEKAKSREKMLEVRKDDRVPRFEPGDIAVLELFRPVGLDGMAGGWRYMGETEYRRIRYVERGKHVPPGYCAFSLDMADDTAKLFEQFFDENPETYGKHLRFRYTASATPLQREEPR